VPGSIPFEHLRGERLRLHQKGRVRGDRDVAGDAADFLEQAPVTLVAHRDSVRPVQGPPRGELVLTILEWTRTDGPRHGGDAQLPGDLHLAYVAAGFPIIE
jgi:hypothetical protein